MQFPGGNKSQYQKNIRAIRILKTLEQEERNATKEEQEILAGYVGWGGLPNAFNSKRPEWKKEYQELKELLTAEEYAQARASVNSSFYTPPEGKNSGTGYGDWKLFSWSSGKYAKIPALWRGD